MGLESHRLQQSVTDSAKSVQKNNQPEIITDNSMHQQVVTTKEKYSEHFTNFQIFFRKHRVQM
jgi:hypothetical protein